MIKTEPPTQGNVDPTPKRKPLSRPSPNPPRVIGSWRYDARPRRRSVQIFAICLAVGLHAGLFYGFRHGPKKAAPPNQSHTTDVVLTLIDLKDLEEPDPPPTDQPVEKLDVASFVPMQADQPQIPQPRDFVQDIDFASLVPTPEIDHVQTFSIPDHINRSGKGKDGVAQIFSLSDLDRQPEAIVRPAPIFPSSLKHDVPTATVRVEFIIGADGHAKNAFVIESTHSGFNNAAIAGVEKWQYRPGIRKGRKVNTRMQVPIIFSLSSDDEK
jgi:protein TonB